MADTKITALTAITTVDPAVDVLPIVDVSDTTMAASGTTKKITSNQILGAGGTATLASATITGDLTVDTNTLKVDSANNRVGVGTASPAYPLDLDSTLGTVLNINSTNANGPGLRFSRSGTVNGYVGSAKYTVGGALADFSIDVAGANNLIFGVNDVEQMRLNSTGLGVGTSPTNKLTIGTGAYAAGTLSGTSSLYSTVAQGLVVLADGLFVGTRTGGDRFTLDTSGNVGIGVTPSAWGGAWKVIEFNNGHSFGSAGSQSAITQNAYNNGTNWIYKTSSLASLYQANSGVHYWYNAPSGTAGNAITFTQAMTLDTSGYLLIGTTDTAFTSGAGYKFGPGATPSSGQVGASSSNGDLTYRLYSTGAAAYRFYVGFGGTVFATNTTISAISDARLKENVQDIDVGLGAILALKPRKFDWKDGKGKDIKGDRGFIAQEFEQVFPQLVDQWADEAPEGEAPYKSVRQDLIPVLVKAIQELAAEVNALKNA